MAETPIARGMFRLIERVERMKTSRAISSDYPPDSGADFLATREHGLALSTPHTSRARTWLNLHASAEATWSGESLVVELRFFPGIADAIIDTELTFERDAYVN